MEVSLQSFRKRFTYDPQKDLLGKGGFGEVYKAYDNEDQVYVALKISQGTADDKYNLINEIKQFKKLNHPNIVNHIEAYEVNTGSTDIHGKPILYHVGILEYADKGTLADFLKSKTPTGFRQTIEDLANDIIDGLAYLHSQNIIHRDLKPTNILLFSDGEKLRAKITDFGIAKKADATAASTQLVGTVEYMAPEYFTTGNITKASDIWSLGVMLLEALSGTHPFGKTTQGLSNEQIIRNILSKDLQENLANAPLKELLTRCLLREANLRPQSAEELKGLMLSGGDAFTEMTQVISKKQKVLEAEKGKSKWRRWLNALFDFKVNKETWKRFIAKEITLVGLFIPLFLVTTFLFLVIVNPYRLYTKHQYESQLHDTEKYLSQNEKYRGKFLKFSRLYFTVYSAYPENNPKLYTSLGYLYSIFRDVSIRAKYKKENLFYFDIANNYYNNSYASFVEELRRYSINNIVLFNHIEEQIKLFNLQNRTNIDLRSTLNSINNLDIDMPEDGGENNELFYDAIDYSYFRIKIQIKLKNRKEVDWYYLYRVRKNLFCSSFLSSESVKSADEFYDFLQNAITYENKKIDVGYLGSKIFENENFVTPLDWKGEGFNYGQWICIALIFLLYPFRILIAICLWSYSTLKKKV